MRDKNTRNWPHTLTRGAHLLFIAALIMGLVMLVGPAPTAAQSGAVIEVSQPVQVTDNGNYERGQSIVYDGTNYWLFYGRSDSVTGNYDGDNPDTHDYRVYYKKANSVSDLPSATPTLISGVANNASGYLGESGAAYFGGDTWAFATIDKGTSAELYGWWTNDGGSTWTEVGPIVTALSTGQAHHDEIAFDGELWVLEGSGDFTTRHSATPKTGGWSTPLVVDSDPSVTGGLAHFFVDGSSLYLAAYSNGKNYIYEYNSTTTSWDKIDEVSPPEKYDPTLFKVNSTYVFAQAPWESGGTPGGRQYLIAWSGNTLDSTFFDGGHKSVTAGKYGTNSWVDMWPIGFIDAGGTSYLFYTSERNPNDPSSEIDGNIWYLEVDWDVSRDHYTYIQEAVDAAGAGDTINVAAGTYNENVTVNKDVTVSGMSDPSGSSPAQVNGTVDLAADGATIEKLKVVSGNVSGNEASIQVSASNTTVDNNVVDGLTGDGTGTIKGIHIYDGSTPAITNITITNNTIQNIDNQQSGSDYAGADGIMVQGVLDGVTVSGNSIKDIHSAGWAYGMEVTPTGSDPSNPPQNVTSENNTVNNVNDGSVYSVNPSSAPYEGAAFSVDVAGSTPADAGQITLRNNSFENTPAGVLNKDTSHTLDAEQNWWGAADGPAGDGPGTGVPAYGTSASLGAIDYSPWLGDTPDAIPMTWGTDDSIQDAIYAAGPGDTINVAAGTYTENVNISQEVTLQSTAGAGSTTIAGSSTPVTVSADNVTIDGFTITNPNGTNAIVSSGSSYLTIKNNIITDVGTGASVNSNTHAVAIVGNDADATDITIEDNEFSFIGTVDNGYGGASAIGVGWSTQDYNVSNLLIQNNTISAIRASTSDWASSEPHGQGAYGILIGLGWGSGTGETVDLQILDNDITDVEGLWSRGIGLEGPTPNAVVRGNDISNIVDHKDPSDAVGVHFEANPDADTVAVHFNNFENVYWGVAQHADLLASADLTVDAENNWWGASDGPSGGTGPQENTGATGSGVAVSADVDFDPWIGAATDEVESGELGPTDELAGPAGSSAQNTGGGTYNVTLAKYTSNPSTVNNFAGGDSFFDIFVDGAGPSDSLQVTLPAGSSTGYLYYYDGSVWKPVLDSNGDPVLPSGGNYTFTLNDNSQPKLTELAGTEFAGGGAEEIRITPSVTTVAAGETFEVVVDASSAALYGVDVTMTFDENELEVTQILLGDDQNGTTQDLSADTIAVKTKDNTNGNLRFAFSQKGATVDNLSGNPLGLATITFRAHSAGDGSATVNIDSVEFTDKDGNTPSSIGVLDSPANLTVNPSPTVTADVTLQGRDPGEYGGVSLELTPTGTGNVLFDADGSSTAGALQIENVPGGEYNARISMPKYLAAAKTDTVPADVATYSLTSTSLRLLGGDVNQDDQINIQDLAILGSRFGSTGADDVALADINDDGTINIQDLAIAGGNFGLKTDNPPAYSW